VGSSVIDLHDAVSDIFADTRLDSLDGMRIRFDGSTSNDPRYNNRKRAWWHRNKARINADRRKTK
jgi:hypothetical protein